MATCLDGTVTATFTSAVTLVSFKIDGVDVASTPGVGVSSTAFTADITTAGSHAIEVVVDKGGGCLQTETDTSAVYSECGGGGGGGGGDGGPS